MASLTASPTARKSVPRAYRAIQDETPGTLTSLNGVIYFFSDVGDFTTVEPQHLNFLTVLGEIGLYETKAILDQMHGGFAQIACSRPN